MKIKVYNLYKQIGNGKGDVNDWTSKQVTIENGILKSNDGSTSSPIIASQVIQNKDVIIFVTHSGSVYVTSTEPTETKPPKAPQLKQSRSRVPSGKPPVAPPGKPPAAPQLKQSLSRVPLGNPHGKFLVTSLQKNINYLQFIRINSQMYGDSEHFRNGLEQIIIENDINKKNYEKMIDKSRSLARGKFENLEDSKKWWSTIYKIINNQ